MNRTAEQAYADLSARGFACGCPVPPFGEIFPKDSCVPRYAMRADRESYVCIPCSEEEVRAFGRAQAYGYYLSSDGRTLTTFTGKPLARVTAEWSTRGVVGGKVTHVRAVAPDGSHWYGKGAGRGMCLTVRHAKGQVAA